MSQTVVITGASAGIGRATAREFAKRGAHIGLIARGRAGLEAAAREVEQLGGKALVLPADVADPGQVRAAAQAVEEAFGRLDVWVNVAFTSVFAPFTEIEPEEFRRVTEVTYLGAVNGLRTALEAMRPSDHGVIVQVGSAMGYRAIPLQSAYSGAKHAVNGVASSIRTELMHEGSNVKLTVVQMPAVNTPQFSWVLSRMPNHPQPVPPIYQPELAARSIIYAADHPQRKQYYVGLSTALTVTAEKFFAGLLDRYLAKTGYKSQQTDQQAGADRPRNLWEPVDGEHGHDFGAHGEFDRRSHSHDPQLWFSRHVRLASAVTAAVTGLGAAAALALGQSAIRRHSA